MLTLEDMRGAYGEQRINLLGWLTGRVRRFLAQRHGTVSGAEEGDRAAP